MPDDIKAVLDGGAFRETPRGMEIMAFSLIADACAAQVSADVAHDDADRAAARRCVERAFAQAMKTKPKAASFDTGREGLWLSHVNLILGDGDATGPCLDHDLHRRVSRGLKNGSLADPTGLTSSYASKRERWPADQAATLASLKRYEHAHDDVVTPEVLAEFVRATSKASDKVLQLPWSELHGMHGGTHPRGCALSFSIRYLAEVHPTLARQWWQAYAKNFVVDRVVLVGFREWPPGVNRGPDVDSGPIVQGVGASATAFAVAAARTMGDEALALRLEATDAIVSAAATVDEATKKASASTLASAIRFQGAHARPVPITE